MKLAAALCSALCAAVLSGCAAHQVMPGDAADNGKSCANKPTQEQELALNLAKEMADEGRLYAALANLQGLPQSSPEVRLRQARIMRSIGRGEAQELYQSLIGTCLTAAGEQGLGQLAAARGDQAEALQRLERAASLAPTDAKIRNDLGVVYLRLKRTDDARFEFLTAVELSQSDNLPATNLLALLFVEDKSQQAADLVSRLHLSATEVREALKRSEQLKSSAPTLLPLASQASKPDPAAVAVVGVLGEAVSQITQDVQP
ncbi:tetratricopeptide repeat protein [Pseudomonas sp. EL_65y_Pfl2_R95]|uniref:tetratricopeptide repeat protein n=1 Tax=Pseudomonas sp. EL_65y_Pfl2_R95 TaxID=3088698 RepID=UPI0030DCB25F